MYHQPIGIGTQEQPAENPTLPTPAPAATELRPASRVWKAIGHYQRYGAKQTAELIRKNLAFYVRRGFNKRFDRKFHVDTSGVIQLSELACSSPNKARGYQYEATPIRTLKLVFSLLPEDVRDLTFIDFGSGKGRTILYASNFNFRRVIGVEFVHELHLIAEKNIRNYRNRRQKCFDVTSVHGDAASFPLPSENCVLYFFAPFRYDVMERVCANLRASYERSPRKIILLYCHLSPQSRAVIENLGFLRKREERKMPFDLSAEPHVFRRTVSVYETV